MTLSSKIILKSYRREFLKDRSANCENNLVPKGINLKSWGGIEVKSDICKKDIDFG